MSPFYVVPTAQRLVLRRKQFAAAPEYAKAISRGKAVKFMEALMAALGNAMAMCVEDTCGIIDRYMSNKCDHKVSPSTPKTEGTWPSEHR